MSEESCYATEIEVPVYSMSIRDFQLRLQRCFRLFQKNVNFW